MCSQCSYYFSRVVQSSPEDLIGFRFLDLISTVAVKREHYDSPAGASLNPRELIFVHVYKCFKLDNVQLLCLKCFQVNYYAAME